MLSKQLNQRKNTCRCNGKDETILGRTAVRTVYAPVQLHTGERATRFRQNFSRIRVYSEQSEEVLAHRNPEPSTQIVQRAEQKSSEKLKFNDRSDFLKFACSQKQGTVGMEVCNCLNSLPWIPKNLAYGNLKTWHEKNAFLLEKEANNTNRRQWAKGETDTIEQSSGMEKFFGSYYSEDDRINLMKECGTGKCTTKDFIFPP